MGLIANIGRAVSAPPGRRMRAFFGPSGGYEGAAYGRRLFSFKPLHNDINASLLSDLETLRGRSYSLVRNNPWIRNAVGAYVANIVSTGIKPQFQVKKKNVKADMQAAWTRWTDEADFDGKTDFYGLETMAVRAIIVSGECFVRFIISDDPKLSVPLQLQLMGGEMLDTRYNMELGPQGAIRAGIEFDASGKRVAYWFWKQNPGSAFFPKDAERIRVPADEVLHLYSVAEPGQLRGEPWLAPVIVKIHEIEQFDDATLVGQKIAAMFAGFITENNPDDPVLPANTEGDDGQSAPQGTEVLSLEPGTLHKLLPGEDIKFSTPHGVGASYETFMRTQLLAVAVGLGITYEMLTGDLKNVNYSSIRAGRLEFIRRAEQFQHQVVVFQLCRAVVAKWIDLAIMSGAFRAPGYVQNKRQYTDVKWIAPGWPWVDPLKDITALGLEVLYGFTSRQSVVSQKGEDVEVVDQEQKQDNERSDSLGLSYDSDGRKELKLAALKGGDGAGGGGSKGAKGSLPARSSEHGTQDNEDPKNLGRGDRADLMAVTRRALEIIALVEDREAA